jgi:hypothetical protein
MVALVEIWELLAPRINSNEKGANGASKRQDSPRLASSFSSDSFFKLAGMMLLTHHSAQKNQP